MKRLMLLCLCLVCAACAPAREVNFYMLSAPEASAGQSAAMNGPRVGVLPVNVPEYLQHRQIVTLNSDGASVKVDDYSRWNETLSAGLTRVISAVINQEIAPSGGVATPVRPGLPVDMRVVVDVARFDGQPGGDARLEALWTVRRGNASGELPGGRFSAVRSAGPDLPSMVRALSELAAELGAAIADSVKALPPLSK